MTIEAGLTYETEITVQTEHTAASLGGDHFAPVLSTPYLIGLMEGTAHTAVLPFLEKGQSGVGSQVNIRHIAATPVGMKVRIRAELVEVDGRRLLFKVEARDEVEKIAEGEHERFIIDWERFMNKVKVKEKQCSLY